MIRVHRRAEGVSSPLFLYHSFHHSFFCFLCFFPSNFARNTQRDANRITVQSCICRIWCSRLEAYNSVLSLSGTFLQLTRKTPSIMAMQAVQVASDSRSRGALLPRSPDDCASAMRRYFASEQRMSRWSSHPFLPFLACQKLRFATVVGGQHLTKPLTTSLTDSSNNPLNGISRICTSAECR